MSLLLKLALQFIDKIHEQKRVLDCSTSDEDQIWLWKLRGQMWKNSLSVPLHPSQKRNPGVLISMSCRAVFRMGESNAEIAGGGLSISSLRVKGPGGCQKFPENPRSEMPEDTL